MSKTFDILKKRWREVAFIIACTSLPYIITLACINMLQSTEKEHALSSFLIQTIGFGITITSSLAWIGFLRTIYLYGTEKQSIVNLLRHGSRFFGRLFMFVLTYFIVLICLRHLVFTAYSFIVSADYGFKEAPPYIAQLCLVVSNMLLIKVLLLTPIILLVFDCNISKCFYFLRYYRLKGIVGIAALYLFSYFMKIKIEDISIGINFINFSLNLVTSFLSLLISVLLIRYVSKDKTLIETIRTKELGEKSAK